MASYLITGRGKIDISSYRSPGLLEEQGISDEYHPYICQMVMEMAADFYDAEARKA